jgi:hypothetical protein
MLQGFARGLLALRLGVSSYLIPALSPPPPIALLDAPVSFMGFPEEIFPPYPSGGLIAIDRIERQPPAFVSPIQSYSSSLITVSSHQFPIFLPMFVIVLAIISGFVVVLPDTIYMITNVAKIRNISRFLRERLLVGRLPTSALSLLTSLIALLILWTTAPPIATFLVFTFITSLFLFQQCGLSAVQDTRTPPLLNAIYEQITRGAAGYDNLIAEHDHQRLKDLVSTLEESDEKRRQWKEIATSAKARCAETEMTVSKLRADFTAVMDRVRDLQDQVDRRTKLASDKDDIIQSITEESQVARVRLKYAEDKIAYLSVKLQHERDRRHRKVKELLDEQARVQDSHESEVRRLKQEAQDTQEQLEDEQARVQDRHESEVRRLKKEAQDTQEQLEDEQARVQDRHESEVRRLKREAQDIQEQLDTLQAMIISTSRNHVDGQSALDHNHPPHYQLLTTPPYDSGQLSLSPEQIRDTTPPISSATAQDHRAALEKLFEWMRQEGSQSSQNAVKSNGERDESRLQEELALTKEQLLLAEEEVLTTRRDLEESRETLREVKTHVMFIESAWEMCKAMLREAQVARRSSLTELAEVIDLLRASQAESESSLVKAEASEFRCSQARFLCAALQERVTELEAEIKKLKCPAITPVDSPSFCPSPTDTGTGMCARPNLRRPVCSCIIFQAPLDMEPMARNFDSIYMTVPSGLPCLLESSLPPSSPSRSSSRYSTILSTRADSRLSCPTNTSTGMCARPNSHRPVCSCIFFKLH